MSKKTVSTLKQSPVLQTAPWDEADVSSLQALANGTANAEQQKRALNWIIYKACHFDDLSYRPDSERDSAFADGSRFVALQVNALLTTNLRSLPLT